MSLPSTEFYFLYVTGGSAQLRRRCLFSPSAVAVVANWPLPERSLGHIDLSSFGRRYGIQPRLRIYVGSSFLKFMVLPVPAHVRQQSELALIACAHMTDALGLDAAAWDIVVNALPGGSSMVACATDRRLLASALAMAQRGGLKLASCSPYVVAIWNSLQSKARGHGGAALAAFEEDAYSVLIQREGRVVFAKTMSHRQEPGLVQRELSRFSIALGDSDGEIDVALHPAIAEPRDANGTRLLLTPAHSTDALRTDFRDLLRRTRAKQP